MNRLDVWRLAVAAAAAFAILNVLCALAVVAAPAATVSVFNAWFHGLDLKLLMPPGGKAVTVTQVLFGVLSGGAVSFVLGAVVAIGYNLLGRHRDV